MPGFPVRQAGRSAVRNRRHSAAARQWVLVVTALLVGCAQLSPRVVPLSTAQFELTGLIAVRYDHQASSGNVAWRHAANRDELLITSPLGQGVARIVREHGSVTLTAANGRRYRAASAEALTQRVLGFRLPLKGLADWVRGRPAPDSPARTRYGAAGRLTELYQSGWRIEYLAYGATGRLPSRLQLNYPGLELRLAITRWEKLP